MAQRFPNVKKGLKLLILFSIISVICSAITCLFWDDRNETFKIVSLVFEIVFVCAAVGQIIALIIASKDETVNFRGVIYEISSMLFFYLLALIFAVTKVPFLVAVGVVFFRLIPLFVLFIYISIIFGCSEVVDGVNHKFAVTCITILCIMTIFELFARNAYVYLVYNDISYRQDATAWTFVAIAAALDIACEIIYLIYIGKTIKLIDEVPEPDMKVFNEE